MILISWLDIACILLSYAIGWLISYQIGKDRALRKVILWVTDKTDNEKAEGDE